MRRHPLPSQPSASPCPAPGEEPARARAPAHADERARRAHVLARARHAAQAGAFACSVWRPLGGPGPRRARGLRGCCVQDTPGTVLTPDRCWVPRGRRGAAGCGGASPAPGGGSGHSSCPCPIPPPGPFFSLCVP